MTYIPAEPQGCRPEHVFSAACSVSYTAAREAEGAAVLKRQTSHKVLPSDMFYSALTDTHSHREPAANCRHMQTLDLG